MLNISLKKSNALGAISSGLCMIHCIITPFIFIATTCSASCCSSAPYWWRWIDYIFLVISFAAVYQSTKSSDYNSIKFGLWISWLLLFVLILNLSFGWFFISENIKFIPAFSLIALHLYNIKFCQCKNVECC